MRKIKINSLASQSRGVCRFPLLPRRLAEFLELRSSTLPKEISANEQHQVWNYSWGFTFLIFRYHASPHIYETHSHTQDTDRHSHFFHINIVHAIFITIRWLLNMNTCLVFLFQDEEKSRDTKGLHMRSELMPISRNLGFLRTTEGLKPLVSHWSPYARRDTQRRCDAQRGRSKWPSKVRGFEISN